MTTKLLLKHKIKIVVLIILAGIIFGSIWGYGKFQQKKDKDEKIYEVAVQMYDQKNSDPEEDARTCLKKGDVVIVFPEGHNWSHTEKVSYLILKMKLSEEEAQKIVEPVTKQVRLENGKNNQDEKKGMPETKIIQLRKYRIKLKDLKFNPKEIIKKQPFEDRIFTWKIVEKK